MTWGKVGEYPTIQAPLGWVEDRVEHGTHLVRGRLVGGRPIKRLDPADGSSAIASRAGLAPQGERDSHPGVVIRDSAGPARWWGAGAANGLEFGDSSVQESIREQIDLAQRSGKACRKGAHSRARIRVAPSLVVPSHCSHLAIFRQELPHSLRSFPPHRGHCHLATSRGKLRPTLEERT